MMYKTDYEMNKYLILASAVACLVVAGCAKVKEKDFADDQVVFSATTGALETRTEYGETGSVSDTPVQYVDWVTGDEITILMSTGSTDDYTVTNINDGSDSDGLSKASLSAQGGGLSWGTGTGNRTFYAMYPKSGTNGSSLAMESGSPTMSCIIPATWNPTDAILERLPNGYMFARLETPRTTSVSLTFDPKFTAFCFTLKNPTESAVKLSSFTLSSASKAMSGTYTVNTSNGDVTNPTAGDNKSVTVNFSSLTDGGLVIPAGTTDNPGTRTFTIVTVPDAFNDLTVSCVSGGVTKTRMLKQGSTYYSFAAGKKHNISITLPEFTAVTYTFSVISPTDLGYAAGTSNTGRVTSYKTNNVPVSWSVENYYASAADAESKTNPLGTPSWLTSGLGSNMTGGTDQTLNIVHTAITPVEEKISSDIAATINAAIAGRGIAGESSDPINLANSAGGTGTYITESANCYIVDRRGYYKIPLVMGNGIRGNMLNTNSLTYQGYQGSLPNTYVSKYFRDYLNQPVTSPLLQSSSSGAQVPNAFEVTSDVTDLIDGVELMGATSSTDDSTPKNVYWLKFHVAKGEQGRAVIKVMYGSTVMWSYHIWVADHDSSQDLNSYMPYPLGWKATGGSLIKKTYSVYARLEQDSPGTGFGVLELKCPETIDHNHNTTGEAPYYQWGRKDPLFDVTQSNSMTVSGTVGFVNHYYKSILNPTKVLRWHDADASYIRSWWNGSENAQYADNLWNAAITTAANTTVGQAVRKTIYDPSPAGYLVPSQISNNLDLSAPQGVYYDPTNQKNAMKDRGTATHAYFWTCIANGQATALFYDGTLSNNQYTFSTSTANGGCVIRVLPVRDPSYTPSNDGTLTVP